LHAAATPALHRRSLHAALPSSTVAQWLWENVLSPVFSWIGEHWSTVLDIMKWAWPYILQPVFNAIAVVARWLWDSVLSPVFSFKLGRAHVCTPGTFRARLPFSA